MDELTFRPIRCITCGVNISTNPMLGMVGDLWSPYKMCCYCALQPWCDVYRLLARRYEIRQIKRTRKYDFNRYFRESTFLGLSELERWRIIVRLEKEGIIAYPR